MLARKHITVPVRTNKPSDAMAGLVALMRDPKPIAVVTVVRQI
jgi:hypothetical protein